MSAGFTMESISFLRESLRRSQKVGLILILLLAASLCLNVIQLVSKPKPMIIGMTQDMAILKITALDQPMINDPALKAWLATARTDSLNMDFLNWRQRLSNARQYFTKEAFEGFAVSLSAEGHLPLLQQYRAIMHAVVTGTPILTRSGKLRGVMTWEFQIPILLNYETSKQRISSQAITAVCRVQRVDTSEYPRGVAISQIITVSNKTAGSR